MDNELTSGQKGRDTLIAALKSLRGTAAAENATQAASVGIAQSAAVTCVKPSGTVSQLVDAASGIHPRHSHHYIRRVRGNDGDPLSSFLSKSGIPSEPCAYTDGSQVRQICSSLYCCRHGCRHGCTGDHHFFGAWSPPQGRNPESMAMPQCLQVQLRCANDSADA